MRDNDDRLPIWWLVRAADTSQRELVPLLRKLDLPITADVDTGEFYSSRSAFRTLLLEVAE
jgi:hypothetical protein